MKCAQSGIELPMPLPPGTLVLLEIPDKPMRTPLHFWPIYHFCSLDELKMWLEDKEQVGI